MNVWLIEPRDPLIFRDGKPFMPTPGARARSLPFPFPSTLAGAVRTRAGQDDAGRFDRDRITELLQVNVRGPILAALNPAGEVEDWLLPAPADSLVLKEGGEGEGRRVWLCPVELEPGEATNLEGGLPVSARPAVRQKRLAGAPHFWRWPALEAWLKRPANDPAPVALSALGIAGLTPESRVHVSIDAARGTAKESMLFETSGLEFCAVEAGSLASFRQYALALETDAELGPGVDFLGGERRLVHWAASERPLPACPDAIRRSIVMEKHCRLLLATPAPFRGGHLPEWVRGAFPGLAIDIVAAAVPRYRAVSGWDAQKKEPKASRRLAPAGSVYFLSLDGDAQAIERFVAGVWLQPVSDEEQDRRDGFGLGLLGAWDGKIEPLEVSE